jgi:predicted glycoside hydrolase/deacetylase ChbG (UPF0249 family)
LAKTASRQIWLCADDYGLSLSVNAGVRELIARGRLNAVSVMVAAPHLGDDEAPALELLNAGRKRAAIGLHVTLTGPFKPMSASFAPVRDQSFLPLPDIMRAAVTRRLQPEVLVTEIATQMQAFIEAFGHLPDFVDGHQHVHLFPQVRDAFLKVVAETAPTAWVRQCGRANSLRRLHDRKALVLDILSIAFRRRAERRGLITNPAFAGSYDFKSNAKFAKIFPRFLTGLPDGGLIMCHPGHVDAELERLDTLTHLREREFVFLNSDDFSKTLDDNDVALIRSG